MIILVFFTPFFIAIAWLYFIDLGNTTEINEYFSKNKCKNIIYYKSKYKAVCQNKVLSINNQFNIDFSSNEVIYLKNILKLSTNNNSIDIISKNKQMKLEFKNEKDNIQFLNILKEKIDK